MSNAAGVRRQGGTISVRPGNAAPSSSSSSASGRANAHSKHARNLSTSTGVISASSPPPPTQATITLVTQFIEWLIQLNRHHPDQALPVPSQADMIAAVTTSPTIVAQLTGLLATNQPQINLSESARIQQAEADKRIDDLMEEMRIADTQRRQHQREYDDAVHYNRVTADYNALVAENNTLNDEQDAAIEEAIHFAQSQFDMAETNSANDSEDADDIDSLRVVCETLATQLYEQTDHATPNSVYDKLQAVTKWPTRKIHKVLNVLAQEQENAKSIAENKQSLSSTSLPSSSLPTFDPDVEKFHDEHLNKFTESQILRQEVLTLTKEYKKMKEKQRNILLSTSIQPYSQHRQIYIEIFNNQQQIAIYNALTNTSKIALFELEEQLKNLNNDENELNFLENQIKTINQDIIQLENDLNFFNSLTNELNNEYNELSQQQINEYNNHINIQINNLYILQDELQEITKELYQIELQAEHGDISLLALKDIIDHDKHADDDMSVENMMKTVQLVWSQSPLLLEPTANRLLQDGELQHRHHVSQAEQLQHILSTALRMSDGIDVTNITSESLSERVLKPLESVKDREAAVEDEFVRLQTLAKSIEESSAKVRHELIQLETFSKSELL